VTVKRLSPQLAVDALYERYLSRILKFFRKKGLGHADVDDVMQDTYLRLRRAHDLEGISDPH
jgi:DNA-directed RNA polymerase specialized sigma24 family protein